MNERIKELYLQAVEYSNGQMTFGDTREFFAEKFAELIVRECKENFAKVWYEQGLDIRGAELDKFMKRFNEHFGVDK